MSIVIPGISISSIGGRSVGGTDYLETTCSVSAFMWQQDKCGRGGGLHDSLVHSVRFDQRTCINFEYSAVEKYLSYRYLSNGHK